MIVLYLILGIAVIGIVICIIGATNAKKNQKKSSSTTNQNNSSRLIDRKNEILDEQSKLRNEINKIADSIDSDTPLNLSLDIGIKLERMMTELVKKYADRNDIDSDFAKLLDTCKEKVLLDKKEFVEAWEECKKKNIVELQEFFIDYEKRRELNKTWKKLSDEKIEWLEVGLTGCPGHERTTWTNPQCEEYSKKFQKLNEEYANIESELNNDESYKRLNERVNKWGDYMIHSIIVFDKIHGNKAYQLGRKNDKIGIWDDNGDGKVISIDDVLYFQVKEKISTLTSSTSKPSKLGTAMNEAIWGTAAATASAINKMNQNTNSYTHMDKRAKIYFKFETGISPLEAITTGDVDKLMSMMPEKLR